MTTGHLFLVGSLLGFGLLGIFHKVADHPSCRPRVIALILLFWAGVLTALYTAFNDPHGLHFPPKVIAIGALGGLCSSMALFTFQTGLKHGKISTSWLIINLSMSLPIVISIFVFSEKLNVSKLVGILLVLTAIVLMWKDKKADLDKAGPATPQATAPGRHRKWLVFMMLAFVFNGLAASSQKVLVEAGAGDYTWQFYNVLYTAGFLLMAVFTLAGRHLPNLRELATGFIMALCSIAGNVLLTLALAHNVPGSVAFPVGNGGSLTLVVLAGVLFFKEHVSSAGFVGIACGLTAILVLIMS
jgi:drug/metabolite transporter (DMT)-like permease